MNEAKKSSGYELQSYYVTSTKTAHLVENTARSYVFQLCISCFFSFRLYFCHLSNIKITHQCILQERKPSEAKKAYAC